MTALSSMGTRAPERSIQRPTGTEVKTLTAEKSADSTPTVAAEAPAAAPAPTVAKAEVKIKLGEYLAQSGQPAKAIALLSSFAGDDPDALVALGNAYQISGKRAEAVKTFQR